MGPIGYVIAILGCADGGASCQTVATLAPRYQSAAQCAAARDGALDSNSDLDFPTLIAQCQKSGARPVAAKASDKSPTTSRLVSPAWIFPNCYANNRTLSALGSHHCFLDIFIGTLPA